MAFCDNERITVWERFATDGDQLDAWQLVQTNDAVGTKAEYKYFRVINDHGKHFFHGPRDYIEFSGAECNDDAVALATQAWQQRNANALPGVESEYSNSYDAAQRVRREWGDE